MDIIKIIKNGGVGVLPTDTIYGLAGSALFKKAVERIYKIRKRKPSKPFIILISGLNDLKSFGIKLSVKQKSVLNKIWPGKVSVILPCESDKFKYLHRGTMTLAFRFSDKKDLIGLLKKTGPLVAPSANFEGELPALTINGAKNYFGDKVDFYVDAGELDSLPSTLIEIKKNGAVVILREGAVKIMLCGKFGNSDKCGLGYF